jgi:hypothetical protein
MRLVSTDPISRDRPAGRASPPDGRRRPRSLASMAMAIVILALACAGAPAAYAQFSCQSTGGNWTTASSWTNCNGVFPNNGGGNTYDSTVTSGTSTLTAAVTVGNVTIDSGADWLTSASGSTIALTGGLANGGFTGIDSGAAKAGQPSISVAT